MKTPVDPLTRCHACRGGVAQPFPFSMAFQPVVDVESSRVFAYEALVRGINNESAASVLSQVTPENRYAFDQGCRVAAITLAKRLGLDSTKAKLSINFMPGAVYSPAACIRLTLKTARELGFPSERLIFEITEAEEVTDRQHLAGIFAEYRQHGFKMALDDFGAGFCGLGLFAQVTPDIVKIDMDLTRNLHVRPVAEATIRAIAGLCRSLKIQVVAEGVETLDEYLAIRRCGVTLMQGYFIAKPAFEALPHFSLPQEGAMESLAPRPLAFADPVGQYPPALSSLQVFHPDAEQLGSTKSAADQNCKDRPIRLPANVSHEVVCPACFVPVTKRDTGMRRARWHEVSGTNPSRL